MDPYSLVADLAPSNRKEISAPPCRQAQRLDVLSVVASPASARVAACSAVPVPPRRGCCFYATSKHG